MHLTEKCPPKQANIYTDTPRNGHGRRNKVSNRSRSPLFVLNIICNISNSPVHLHPRLFDHYLIYRYTPICTKIAFIFSDKPILPTIFI